VLQTLLWISRPIGFMDACRQRYGTMFTAHFTGLGASRNIVFVADPAGVREVFAGDPGQLLAGRANVTLGAILGEHSLLLLDGAQHLRERKLMSPPFHGERMRAYEATMQRAPAQRVRAWQPGRELKLLPEMQRITLDVIVQAVFGFDDPMEQAYVRGLLQRMLALGSGSARVAALAFARVEAHGLTPWGKFCALKRQVDAALVQQIRRRRASAEQRDDVLTLLLASTDEQGVPLSDEDLCDELLTLLVAGHETTATAMAWALDLLLHHPAELAALQDSLAEGDSRRLDAVIKEPLRLRPVLPIVARLLTQPFRVMGQTLPRGTVVAPCIYLTQRDPNVYPEPDQFRPARFLDRAPEPYSWLPFGGGVRRCLGASFAAVEMRIVLTTILQSVRLRAQDVRLERVTRRAVTLVPRQGTRVLVEQRIPAGV